MKWFAAILLLLGTVGFVVYTVGSHTKPSASSQSYPNPEKEASPTSTGATQPRQYTVLLDVSASRPAAMIADGEQYVDTLIDHMTYGDRLVMLPVYEAGVQEAKTALELPMIKSPSSLILDENEELKTARNRLKNPVHLFFSRAQTKPVMHTDILTTLSIASEKISDGKRNEMIFLSDMLQSSKEFEFEHLKRMPPPGWIEERKQQGLIRPLDGACIVVVGGDPSTREGVVAREFWEKYFEASNATLRPKNYRTTPPSGDPSQCD